MIRKIENDIMIKKKHVKKKKQSRKNPGIGIGYKRERRSGEGERGGVVKGGAIGLTHKTFFLFFSWDENFKPLAWRRKKMKP